MRVQRLLRAKAREDLPQLRQKFREATFSLADLVQDESKWYVKQYWTGWVNAGHDLAMAILDAKAIPKGKHKKLEAASRPFVSARRTNDASKWFIKNYKNALFLIDAARVWPDAEEGVDEFKLGPFLVHNTMGLDDDDLEDVKKSIVKIARIIKKSSTPPGFSKVLYGDIHIVDRLHSRGSVMAFYSIQEDALYIRPGVKTAQDEMHSTIHELGHRYWRKFAKKDAQSTWATRHMLMGMEHPSPEDVPEVQFPGVGDIVPIAKPKGRGKNKRQPTVVKIDGPPGHRKFWIDERGYFKEEQFRGHAVSKAKREMFPTAYAEMNYEEHFCEAVSLFLMGKLKEPHLSKFIEIF